MKNNHRKAIRVASQIERRLATHEANLRGCASSDQDIAAAMDRYLKLRSYLQLARSRQWMVAGRHVSRQVDTVLQSVNHRIREHQVHRVERAQAVSSVADIFRDLQAVCEEFDGWEMDQKEAILSVKTESIELEGVDLGPFEIRLHIRLLEQSDLLNTFEVVALKPNTAAGNGETTHPHVNGDRLCCGEGSLPIQAALRAGRICDFFVLVRSVLQTYNPGSAYVSLDSWSGTTCYECGDLANNDDIHFCDHCEHDCCDGCTGSCSQCDGSSCLSCLDTCPECHERVCPGCRGGCQECGQTLCNACLHAGLCPACKEQKENDHDAIKQTNASPRVPASLATG